MFCSLHARAVKRWIVNLDGYRLVHSGSALAGLPVEDALAKMAREELRFRRARFSLSTVEKKNCMRRRI